ncbi:histidine phosphatase family protein [uncultured Tateyamaria sp.]|uniref:histidine phosphatase family protein n=1 Tax=uncultured Tateyamaria sp. TaxID=455651 RepID=UPI00262E7A4F|nr:histidine phosphatase family protein [uncultured Tateyamaria sp.]
MIRLALLRHGHTHWNRAGRIQGRTDIPLDDAARAQLGDMRLPDDWADADLVASPLSRAMETGTLLTGRTPLTEPALIEMDWGTWEGKQGADLRRNPASGFRDIQAWGWDYCPPGGEDPQAVRDRVLPWAQSLRHDTVAICHIGVMRVLMAISTGWDFTGPAPFQIKRNRLFCITIDGTDWHAEPHATRLIARST